MNSFIPWVGGKSKLLWIINKMAPDHYSRFIDVFGGSGTVTMSRPIQPGCMEVYNDFNSNLTNLFCCVKNRPLALLAELGFLPLNTRDDFNVLYKFLSKGEITDDYLQEEMELTEILLKPPEAEAIRTLLLERAPRGDVRRAADFFKLVRYSFSGSSKSFGGKPCDIRRFFHLIWECSRRLANVIVENKDFEDVIRQYDRGDAWIYCDPPYFEAEGYEVAFPTENHQRLHDTLLNCHGYVMVSYNYCPYICELYQEFYIFRVVRPNSMSQYGRQRHEEGVAHRKFPLKAHGHTGGDGAPGPGQAGDGGKALGHAHQQHVGQGGIPGSLASLVHPVGEKEDAAGDQQGTADKNGVGAKGLYLALKGQHQKQRQGAHNDQQHQPPGLGRVAPGGLAGKKRGQTPEKLRNHLYHILKIVDAYGHQGGKVEQDVKEIVRLFHAEEVLEQGQVPGAGDGQKLSHALDKAQNGRH